MKGLQKKTFQAILEFKHVEVDQEPVPNSSQFHIGQKLGSMDFLTPLSHIQSPSVPVHLIPPSFMPLHVLHG